MEKMTVDNFYFQIRPKERKIISETFEKNTAMSWGFFQSTAKSAGLCIYYFN